MVGTRNHPEVRAARGPAHERRPEEPEGGPGDGDQAGDEGEARTEPELVRRAAMLRKRFERIKDELRALAKAEGLGSRD